jgi:DNA-binding MarR family transcriptional regulator
LVYASLVTAGLTEQPSAMSADPLSLDQQVCFAVVVAARSIVGLYRPILEPMGLTHPQYLVMLALWQNAPLSVKRLSELLQLDPGTLSPLLKRLESAELIVRRRNRADERHLAVELTDRGRALREQALQVPPAVVKRLGMSIEELQALHASLTRVIDASLTPAHRETDR